MCVCVCVRVFCCNQIACRMLDWYLKRVVCIFHFHNNFVLVLVVVVVVSVALSVLVIIRYVFIVKCGRVSIWIYTLIIITDSSIIWNVPSYCVFILIFCFQFFWDCVVWFFEMFVWSTNTKYEIIANSISEYFDSPRI